MLAFIWLFWYCFDDWVAQAVQQPNVGTLPFFLWLVVFLGFCALGDFKITIKN